MMLKTHLNEIPVVFDCEDKKLVGMIHQANINESVGVLIIVGGLQTRVGSHRQFILLARHLAQQGFVTMRFDVRGLGDSEGEYHDFEQIDEDIRAAMDCFFEVCPTLKHVVLWGLCDAASAALFYGYQDSRVKGLVLLNPWVFTEKGAAETVLKQYYWQRLTRKDFWRKVFSGRFNYGDSFSAFINLLKKRFISKTPDIADVDLPTRMRDCTKQFEHRILLILSGNDLTAAEFKNVLKSDVEWQKCLKNPRVNRVNRVDIIDADHTFSSNEWRHQVETTTTNWLKALKENL